MSEDKAIVPVEQKLVDFYGDEIVTTLPTESGESSHHCQIATTRERVVMNLKTDVW